MSVPSYYIDIGWWSLAKAWDWPNSHSIEFAILTLVCAVFVRWVAARTIPTAERLIPDWASKLLGWFVIPGFGGLLTAFLFVWGALFVSEPAKQRNAAHSQIAKLEERVKESERVANFSFSFPFTRKIADQGVSASITVRNEAEHTIEIDEIKLVRMWVHDMSPFTGGPIRDWCKLVIMSPQASRAPPYDRTIIQIPQEHKNVAFEYLQNDKVSVDGADKPNEASVVEAGKWRIFEITANGGFIITDKEINGVLICPIVVFVDKSKHGIVCPGVASFTNLEEPNRGATYTETSRFPLKDPEPDDRCGKVGPL